MTDEPRQVSYPGATTSGDRQWLRDQLARYTYRPGWTLTLATEPMGVYGQYDPYLLVEWVDRDSRNPDRIIRLKYTTVIPAIIAVQRHDHIFAEWLAQALIQVETHESREWLRRDGQIYNDPHAQRPDELAAFNRKPAALTIPPWEPR